MNMVIDYKRIAQHLKKARKNSMLKQHQVAEALGIVENTYSNIERAQQKPSLTRIIQQCVLYNVSPGTILNDCCDELVRMNMPQEEELSQDKKELLLLIHKCSDNMAHQINVIAQAIYNDKNRK